ncbi:MAG: winged helix-turn-helix domain-containing tetratricopeptide repeat protein [Ruegeria sp.]
MRRALNDSGAEQRAIRTYPKRGYRFVAEVEEGTAPRITARIDGMHGGTRAKPDTHAPGVVVLPFQDYAPPGEKDFLAESLTEEITIALSRCSDLTVFANDTARKIDDETSLVSEIGTRLSAKYVVQGSAMKQGTRLRVTARVLDAELGKHLWADRFEASAEDLFDLQDQVTREIAAVLPTRIHIDTINKSRGAHPEDLSSYQKYLKIIWPLRMGETAVSVADDMEKLIERDENFALAHAHLAVLLGYSAFETGHGDVHLQRVLHHARRALALVNQDERVLTKAALALAFAGDSDGALNFSEMALRLNPNYVKALHIRGNILCAVGQHELAVEHQHRAMRLDPLFPSYYREGLIESLYLLGSYQEAIAEYHRWDHPSEHTTAYLAACYAMTGHPDQARDHAATFLSLRPPDFKMLGFMATMNRYFRRDEDREHWAKGFQAAGLL